LNILFLVKSKQMKKLVAILSFLLIGFQSLGQLKVQDFLFTQGFWQGQLTYLDYTSGKPYSMAANLKIHFTPNQQGYIRQFEYPKEPHANSSDTLYLKGSFWGDGQLVNHTKTSPTDISWVTETPGEDGNDHRKAVLRHSYSANKNRYQIIKEVRFEGTTNWIKRHEYVFTR
jgi:hypothetical protein